MSLDDWLFWSDRSIKSGGPWYNPSTKSRVLNRWCYRWNIPSIVYGHRFVYHSFSYACGKCIYRIHAVSGCDSTCWTWEMITSDPAAWVLVEKLYSETAANSLIFLWFICFGYIVEGYCASVFSLGWTGGGILAGRGWGWIVANKHHQAGCILKKIAEIFLQVLQLLFDNEKVAANELAGRLFKTWPFHPITASPAWKFWLIGHGGSQDPRIHHWGPSCREAGLLWG